MSGVGLVAGAALAALLVRMAMRYRVLAPTLVAIGVQLALSLALFHSLGLAGDAIAYNDQALDLTNSWRGEGPVERSPSPGKESLVWMLAGLYYIGPVSPLSGLLFLAALMGIVPIAMANALRAFGITAVATTAAWLGALSPHIVLWSPWLRREGLSFVLISLGVWSWALLYAHRWSSAWVIGGLAAAGLWITRPQLMIVLAVGIAVAPWLGERRHSRDREVTRKLKAVPGVTALVIALLLLALAVTRPTVGQVADASIRVQSVAATSSSSQALRVETAEFVQSRDESVILLTNLPKVFGPLPVDWDTRERLLVGLDGLLLFLLLSSSLILGFAHSCTRRVALLLAVSALPLLLGMALTLGNYGLVARERAHLSVILLPLVALLLKTLKDECRERWRSACKRTVT